MLRDSCQEEYILKTENETIDISTGMKTDMEATLHSPQKNRKISKIEYLGMGVCAIFILAGTAESIVFGFFLTTIFFGQRIYRAIKQANSELIIVERPKIAEPNYAKTKTPDITPMWKKLTDKATIASGELAEKMQQKIDDAKNLAKRKKQYIDSIRSRSICTPVEVIILGGAGWEIMTNRKFVISMDASTIYMSDLESLIDTSISIDTLEEINISGPGKVTNNAGVIGGGFGAEGALKGIAIANVVNMLTTYSSTKTFIRLGFRSSEIVMLTSQIEPDKARVLLSPLFLKINRRPKEKTSPGASDEIKKLHELKQDGVITDSEFNKLMSKLIDRI
jgi:hypothetical protein